MNKKHGLVGNKNAKKDNPKLGIIHIRVDMRKKSYWVKKAQSRGLTLSQFITIAADKLADEL